MVTNKLLIAGSRHFKHWPLGVVNEVFDGACTALWGRSHPGSEWTVIHGGAKGVDTQGGLWARKLSVPTEVFPADWDTYGKSAGYRRNVIMVDKADAVIILWDGKSAGTKHTLNLSTKKGVPMVVVIRDPNEYPDHA